MESLRYLPSNSIVLFANGDRKVGASGADPGEPTAAVGSGWSRAEGTVGGRLGCRVRVSFEPADHATARTRVGCWRRCGCCSMPAGV